MVCGASWAAAMPGPGPVAPSAFCNSFITLQLGLCEAAQSHPCTMSTPRPQGAPLPTTGSPESAAGEGASRVRVRGTEGAPHHWGLGSLEPWFRGELQGAEQHVDQGPIGWLRRGSKAATGSAAGALPAKGLRA